MLITTLILLIFYALAQLAYSGYYLWRSKRLVKTTFTQPVSLGSGPPLSIFAAGDSLGAGIGATSFETSLAGRVAVQLAKKHSVTLENSSLSGSKMSQLLAVPAPASHQDLILLVISSNDLAHSTDLGAFRASTDQVLQKFAPLASKIIIIGPGNVGTSRLIPVAAWPYFRWRRPKYVDQLQQLSAKYPNITYVNPVDQPSSFTSAYAKDTTSTDKFHLNDEGYRWWADLVLAALR